MIKREELSDPRSCMSKAREDEMTFVLLGRDPASISAIYAWVRARLRFGKNKEDDLQIQDALGCLAAIEDGFIRCSGCRELGGQQHRPSCPRKGLVTVSSDYRDRTPGLRLKCLHSPAGSEGGRSHCVCAVCGYWIERADAASPWVLSASTQSDAAGVLAGDSELELERELRFRGHRPGKRSE